MMSRSFPEAQTRKTIRLKALVIPEMISHIATVTKRHKANVESKDGVRLDLGKRSLDKGKCRR